MKESTIEEMSNDAKYTLLHNNIRATYGYGDAYYLDNFFGKDHIYTVPLRFEVGGQTLVVCKGILRTLEEVKSVYVRRAVDKEVHIHVRDEIYGYEFSWSMIFLPASAKYCPDQSVPIYEDDHTIQYLQKEHSALLQFHGVHNCDSKTYEDLLEQEGFFEVEDFTLWKKGKKRSSSHE